MNLDLEKTTILIRKLEYMNLGKTTILIRKEEPEVLLVGSYNDLLNYE